MNIKKSIWKYATIIFVALTILNPEIFELALFVDAIGLDIFLLLLEIQLIAVVSTLLTPFFKCTKLFYKECIFTLSQTNFKDTLFKLLIYPQGPATIMYILVFSTAFNISL